MHPLRFVRNLAPSLIAMALLTTAPVAYAEETSILELGGPKVITIQDATMAFLAPSRSDANRREQLLREHMLPGPIREAVRPASPLEDRPFANETPVVASEQVLVELNRALTDGENGGTTSLVSESSLAVGASTILATGNWWAALSKDGGSTFRAIDPATAFPSVGGQRFCCDQVALHDEVSGLTIWLLQYLRDQKGNRLRIAVATQAQIQADEWAYYDITTEAFGWSAEWFDFPDLALSDDHLVLTTNTFTSAKPHRFTRSLVIRVPIQDLSRRSPTTLRYLQSTSLFSFRPVQGRGPTMFIGCHDTMDRLKVLRWKDSATDILATDVDIERWNRPGDPYAGPDGRDWLGRSDGRITAAWTEGGRVGFAWNAGADSQRPLPHVRVLVCDPVTGTTQAEPTIWSRSVAFAYPAAGVTRDGRVGISVFYGGGSAHPSHSVGFLREPTALEPDGGWTLVPTAAGTSGPSQAVWGDYGACRRWGSDTGSLGATGWALAGGPNGENVEVRILRFRPAPNPAPLDADGGRAILHARKAAIEKELRRLGREIDRLK